ncbi:carbohydrate-binding module family 63 protein [Sphaerulina musiva SO2202]|uniref:Carbohydrate-binding module family 63 protein n=1 Tax=Sphaerulina musiva (strain SO2202) TaxID=692275 RepID=M3B6S3_SPHMS|nr:carbohydrate-binding module family 63 protein [Sphaerulina musiva SO2202]EMF15502.1 carbohydrate-binding module family 63 protein [Sphaerulina musiva SO2202]
MFSILAMLAAAGTVVASNSGQATFYGGNTQGGMCSFSTYTIPSGIYGTAMSSRNWDGSETCGGCIEVTGPNGKKITVMVVDQCPECELNHLDLFQDAFAELADVSKGIIDVTWEYVDCPITTPLQVHMKEGVSRYWFSAQIVNANKRVASMEYSTDGGSSWKSGLTRQPYNYFELSSGTGTDTVAIRAESVDGDRVVVKGVSVTGGNLVKGPANF